MAAGYLFRVVWGLEIIYAHFMYVPIALASMWWGFWGLAVASGVELAVCGHVHYRRRLTEGSPLFVCNCLGYASEWGANQDPTLEVERALLTLEF